MREIDLDAATNPNVLPRHTILGYGDTRVGKTTWAATMPRPLFLADATEKGWDSIANLAEEFRFEPNVKPRVWAIDNQPDMTQAIAKAAPLVASGEVLTIVIDSISFYSDLALAGIIASQTKYDPRSAYGTLGIHLRELRQNTHRLGASVFWASLVDHPDEDKPLGGPMIPGKQGAKFGAGVEFIFYFRKEVPLNPILAAKTPPVYELRTKPWIKYPAGNRLGGRADLLPDPFIGNYSDFLITLGYDLDAIRKSLPALKAKPTLVKPVTVTSVAAPIRTTVVAAPNSGRPASKGA